MRNGSLHAPHTHTHTTQVWDVSSGACVLGLHQKSVTKEAWPVLHWAPSDAGVWHGVTNTLHFYGTADGFKGAAWHRLCQGPRA